MLFSTPLKTIFLFIAVAATAARPAFAQSPPPATPPAPAYQQPAPGYQPPGGYQPAQTSGYPPPQPPPGQPAPAYQQQPGYQQPAPGYQQPPPGYQQPPPGYQQQAPTYQQQPPPGYQPPPPGYQQGPAPPGASSYAPPPGYALVPLPPPPQRSELQWSLRFNIFDLLFGRATVEIERVITGPLTITVAPQFIFGDPRQDRNLSITSKGYGFYSELGLWVQGRPLRGYFLKGHLGYSKVTFTGDLGPNSEDKVAVPQTQLGLMFGSQSIYGGWFSLSGGFGIAYDLNSADRYIQGRDTRNNDIINATIPASGLFGNGWNLLSQIGLGGSF